MKLVAFRESTNDSNDIRNLVNKYTDMTRTRLEIVENDLYRVRKINKDAWDYFNGLKATDIKTMRMFD